MVSEKSELLVAMLVMFSVEVPVLVMVTLWGALTVPTVWLGNERLVGVIVTAVAIVVPAPVTVIVWVLLAVLLALSVMVNWLVSRAVVEGVKVTLMVQ